MCPGMGQSMKFAFCRAVRMSGMRMSWAMMPGMAVSSAPDKNALNAEVYVRYLENPISSAGGYYWYVAFCPQKYEVYAVLIDPITREITAVRE